MIPLLLLVYSRYLEINSSAPVTNSESLEAKIDADSIGSMARIRPPGRATRFNSVKMPIEPTSAAPALKAISPRNPNPPREEYSVCQSYEVRKPLTPSGICLSMLLLIGTRC
jgi:hypothetical protein